jgi:hypothetical protein
MGRIAEASSVFGEIIKHDPRSIESWSGKVSLHLTDQSNSLDYVDQLTLELLGKFPTDTTAYEWRAQVSNHLFPLLLTLRPHFHFFFFLKYSLEDTLNLPLLLVLLDLFLVLSSSLVSLLLHAFFSFRL